MDFSRTGLEIGPFDLLGLTIHPTFHWYGLLIVSGIIAASAVAAWMAKRDDKDPDHVWNGLIWVVVLAVIFARAWHVLFPSISSVESGRDTAWYLSNFFDMSEGPLIIWSGGLSIFGAVIGGTLGVLLYTYKNKLDIISWLDIAAVVVPLGQAIGRWGNYVNEELYGKPTDLPWGITISRAHLDPNYAAGTHFHPLFLYESLWNLLLFGALLFLWLRFRNRFKQGDFLLLYLAGYLMARFVLEFLRIEIAKVGDVNISQVFSIAVAIIAAAWLVYRHREDLMRSRKSTA